MRWAILKVCVRPAGGFISAYGSSAVTNLWTILLVDNGILGAILLAVMGLGGLILWVIGRSIAKPACVISGLVLGAVAGLAAGTVLIANGIYVIPLMVFGGIIGALLAGLLFRIWMGLSGAVILGLVVPIVIFVWQGTTVITPVESDGEAVVAEDLPAAEKLMEATVVEGDQIKIDAQKLGVDLEQIKDLAERVKTAIAKSGEAVDEVFTTPDEESDGEKPRLLTLSFPAPESNGSGEAGSSKLEDVAAGDDEPAGADAGEAVSKMWQSEAAQGIVAHVNRARIMAWEQMSSWWSERDSSTQMRILLAGGIGALIGLLFGLIAPYVAAAVESALVGALLMMFACANLVGVYLPDYGGYLPSGTRSFLVFLGLITVVGVLIQWMIFRKKADK